MSMVDDFNGILIEHGHNVYVQRRKHLHGSGPYIEIDGSKYEATAEVWTAWRSHQTRMPDEELVPAGLIDNNTGIFYFQAISNIEVGDLIAEDNPNTRDLRDVFRVDYVKKYYNSNIPIYLTVYGKPIEADV
jgi:hypothetical protein